MGQEQVFIQHFSYDVPAGDVQPVWSLNKFLTILNNTAQENIDVSLGGSPFTVFKKGLSYELPENIDHIMIRNSAAISTTVEFYLSSFRVYDNRVIFTDDIAVKDVSNTIETPNPIIALDPLYLIDNAAAVDKGGGKVGIPVTGKPFTDNEWIQIQGTINYNGNYQVDPDSSTDEVVIVATYVAETFDGVDDKIGLLTPRFIPEDLTQKEIIIQNNGSSEVWYGSNMVNSVSKWGTKLSAGSAMVLDLTDDIYFMSLDAGKAGIKVSINRLKKI